MSDSEKKPPERDEGERIVLGLVLLLLFMFAAGLAALYLVGGKIGFVAIVGKIWSAVFGAGK